MRLAATGYYFASSVPLGVLQPASPVLLYLPAVYGHRIMTPLIAAQHDMQRIAVGLYACYHARSGRYALRLLCPRAHA